jgi:hypothetical protein
VSQALGEVVLQAKVADADIVSHKDMTDSEYTSAHYTHMAPCNMLQDGLEENNDVRLAIVDQHVAGDQLQARNKSLALQDSVHYQVQGATQAHAYHNDYAPTYRSLTGQLRRML